MAVKKKVVKKVTVETLVSPGRIRKKTKKAEEVVETKGTSRPPRALKKKV